MRHLRRNEGLAVEQPNSEPRRPIDPKQSELLLDLLRCLAATLVLIYHERILFFARYSDLRSPSLGIKALYFVTGLGPPAVILFFVLSGYLVVGSVVRARRAGVWSIASYLNQRITRLLVPLLPALLLCWLLDAVGLRLNPHSFYYVELWTDTGWSQVAARHGLATFLQNLLFLQGVTGPIFGSDGPLWSLAYEFWYYIFLVPVFVISISRRPRTIILSSIFLLAAMFFVGPRICEYGLIWLLGAATVFAVRIPLRLSKHAALGLLGGSILLMLLTLSAIRFKSIHSDFVGDFLLGATCALFVWSAARQNETVSPTLLTVAAKNYAGWTYSLYLLHMPVLVFIASLCVRSSRWFPDALHLAMAGGILVAVLLYAYAISLCTERRTGAVRTWIAARLNLGRRSPKNPLPSSVA